MTTKQHIRKLATETRKTLIQFAGIIYPHYKQHDLAGLCAYGSILLYNILKNHGYKPQIARGQGHWFILCESFLVDITASQFGHGKVCVKKYEKIDPNIRWWYLERLFNNPLDADLSEHVQKIEKGWVQ